MQKKLDNILAVARKGMPLVEGNAVLMHAGIGLTLLKTEEEKVEFLHAKQKHGTPSPTCQEFETFFRVRHSRHLSSGPHGPDLAVPYSDRPAGWN
jgi:hypothetical protein